MKLYLYYDENLILSILSQLDIPDFDIDFFSVSIEERNDVDYRVSLEPHKKNDNCSMSSHVSTNIFNGKKVEHIYANIEDIKSLRRNKFMYGAIDSIIEHIKKDPSIFYSEGKIKDNMTLLCDVENFKMAKAQFLRCNCDRIVTIAHKISDTCIKPICIYLKC